MTSIRATNVGRRALAAIALLATLLLAACGGGDSGDSGAASTPTTAPAAPAAPAVPPPPGPPKGLAIGLGEQGAAMFADARFKALKVDRARLVATYDTTRFPVERDLVQAWLNGARAAGVEPFVTFGHSREHPAKLPSVAEFRSSFRSFQKAFPEVKVYAPWNEINHVSQPTSTSPERAADYYNVVREECPDCTVLAGDVLDQAGMVRYVKAYRSHLKGTPKIWGLHNYSDTNRFQDKGLRDLLGTVTGDVWLTETGGIVRFGSNFPQDEQRAARAVSYAIKLARANKRVKRVYLYNWTGSKPSDRFDSGLIGPDGKPRPGYARLRDGLKG